MLFHQFCISWFVFEYMYFEEVHTYTYDLFRERVGYKLIWGCFCFYPLLPYQIGAWSLCQSKAGVRNNDLSIPMSFFCILIFFCGWVLTRGANLQKYTFRKSPREKEKKREKKKRTATTFSFSILQGQTRNIGKNWKQKKNIGKWVVGIESPR